MSRKTKHVTKDKKMSQEKRDNRDMYKYLGWRSYIAYHSKGGAIYLIYYI